MANPLSAKAVMFQHSADEMNNYAYTRNPLIAKHHYNPVKPYSGRHENSRS